MTKRYEKDMFYNAMVDALWYNVGNEFVEDLCERYKNWNGASGSFGISDIPDEWYDNECLNQYWSMIVLAFGDYGTSPRSGWVPKSEKADKFFEDLSADFKELGD